MIAKVRNQTLDGFAGLGVVTHDTMVEYEALSQEEKMDGNVHLVLEEEPINANIVGYTDGKTVKDELDDIAEKTGNTDISTIGDGTTTGAIGFLNTHLTNKQPYMDYIIIQTTTTAMTANTAMAIDSGTSNVIDGTTTQRPTTSNYIPVIINAQDTSNHQTTVHFIGASSKWYIRSTVVQKYTIVFYKVPLK